MIFIQKPVDFSPKLEAVGCFVEAGEEILLLKKAPGRMFANLWGIPSGKIKKGELPMEAVIRETEEESGIKIGETCLEYVGCFYIRHPNMDYIYHIFRTSIAKKLPVILSPEHVDYEWNSLQRALEKKDAVMDLDSCIRYVYHVA